jgi:hypothetical protein
MWAYKGHVKITWNRAGANRLVRPSNDLGSWRQHTDYVTVSGLRAIKLAHMPHPIWEARTMTSSQDSVIFLNKVVTITRGYFFLAPSLAEQYVAAYRQLFSGGRRHGGGSGYHGARIQPGDRSNDRGPDVTVGLV